MKKRFSLNFIFLLKTKTFTPVKCFTSINIEDRPDEEALSKRMRSEDISSENLTKKQTKLEGSSAKLRLFVLNKKANEFRIRQDQWVQTES